MHPIFWLLELKKSTNLTPRDCDSSRVQAFEISLTKLSEL